MNPFDSIPFPILTTQRLLLRQLKQSDASAIFQIKSNRSVAQFLNRPLMVSLKEATAFIEKINTGIEKNKWLFWAIELEESKQLVGTICLWQFEEKERSIEIGFEMNPEFQQKGFATESSKAVVDFACQNQVFKKLKGITNKLNSSSIKVMTNAGFSFVRELSSEDKFEEEMQEELVLYEIEL